MKGFHVLFKSTIGACQNFLKDEQGLTTVEYAVAGALVAATLVAGFTNLGQAVLTRINLLATDIA